MKSIETCFTSHFLFKEKKMEKKGTYPYTNYSFSEETTDVLRILDISIPDSTHRNIPPVLFLRESMKGIVSFTENVENMPNWAKELIEFAQNELIKRDRLRNLFDQEIK